MGGRKGGADRKRKEKEKRKQKEQLLVSRVSPIVFPLPLPPSSVIANQSAPFPVKGEEGDKVGSGQRRGIKGNRITILTRRVKRGVTLKRPPFKKMKKGQTAEKCFYGGRVTALSSNGIPPPVKTRLSEKGGGRGVEDRPGTFPKASR